LITPQELLNDVSVQRNTEAINHKLLEDTYLSYITKHRYDMNLEYMTQGRSDDYRIFFITGINDEEKELSPLSFPLPIYSEVDKGYIIVADVRNNILISKLKNNQSDLMNAIRDEKLYNLLYAEISILALSMTERLKGHKGRTLSLQNGLVYRTLMYMIQLGFINKFQEGNRNAVHYKALVAAWCRIAYYKRNYFTHDEIKLFIESIVPDVKDVDIDVDEIIVIVTTAVEDGRGSRTNNISVKTFVRALNVVRETLNESKIEPNDFITMMRSAWNSSNSSFYILWLFSIGEIILIVTLRAISETGSDRTRLHKQLTQNSVSKELMKEFIRFINERLIK